MTIADVGRPLSGVRDGSDVVRDLTALLGGALLLYGLNVNFLTRGDAAMYSDYALLGKFDELTLHIGYYAVLFVVQRSVGALLGIPIHETAVWINVVTGALGVGVAYLLARDLLGDRAQALTCALFFGLGGRVLMNTTTSEIYTLQTLLLMLSFFCFVRERVVGAGILAGLALLVSPLSAFAFLAYPAHDYFRAGRFRPPVLGLLAASALVIYLPYLLVFWRELLWGRRGLLIIDRDTPLRPFDMLVNVPVFFAKHYSVLLLFLIPALAAFRKNRDRILTALAVFLPHLYVTTKLTTEDNVFLMPADFFISMVLAIGWQQVRNARFATAVLAVTLLLHISLMTALGHVFHLQSNRDYATDMATVARTYLIGQPALMLSDWDVGMTLTFFGRPDTTATIEQEPLYRQMVDLTALHRKPIPDLAGRTIFLLDPWSPNRLKELLLSADAIERQREHYGMAARARTALGLDCSRMQSAAPHPMYRCLPQR